MRATFEALLDAVPNLANVVLVVVGAYRVRSGALTVGDVASFVYLFTLLVLPLRLIGFVARRPAPTRWPAGPASRACSADAVAARPAAAITRPRRCRRHRAARRPLRLRRRA